jgi:hypothetical protein
MADSPRRLHCIQSAQELKYMKYFHTVLHTSLQQITLHSLHETQNVRYLSLERGWLRYGNYSMKTCKIEWLSVFIICIQADLDCPGLDKLWPFLFPSSLRYSANHWGKRLWTMKELHLTLFYDSSMGVVTRVCQVTDFILIFRGKKSLAKKKKQTTLTECS